MAEGDVHTARPTERTRIRSAESRTEFIVSGLFTLLLFGTLAYVWTLFAPIAPRNVLNTWTTIMAVTITIMMLLPALYLIRNPGEEETVRWWAPAGKVVAVIYDISIALSIWMLLPYASEGLRLLMVIFYLAAICGQVISTAESLETNAFGVIAIFGSIALFYLNTPGTYSTGIAVFCGAFGVLLMIVAIALRTAMRSAIKARLKAEDTAEQLEAALRSAETERDAKTRFIAAASHDLRQPLHAASLYFEQAQTAEDGTIRERAITGVRGAFVSAGNLLDTILDHLRLEAAAMPVRRRSVAVGEMLAHVAALHEGEARLAGMTIRVRPTRLAVEADPALIERALGNLVLNAIRHSRGERVLLTARRRGGKVEIYVIDDGQGIPATDREELFQEYVQGRSTRQDPRGGLGLGLASAQRIMALHGTMLMLETRWRGGAAFRLSLPGAATDVPVSGAVQSVPGSLSNIAGLAILIVEDIEDAGRALAALLESTGAAADWVPSVKAAAAQAAARRYDLVITDWRLSLTQTGADALAAIRQHQPDLPAIVMTGDGAPSTLAEIVATGARLLHKPATPARVFSAIAETVSRKGAA
ncbi:hybrid sensor histidine kinase/response regulator [Parvularcula flava]|uniref:histidine kinase n=1 Tax=Aquisalinus luteolus TaxID=1566827 RepID=A0A8J3ETJ9_9PROT|nr:hybrid sensor histidine kinase/response regulator [Aquisalinus luteolus]NHK27038.1 hybrid sensor histidine kinase/response regulator [Aquisalinus luteolus]GGH94175.1 hybrid sensor histidine kinase/response regulator [Aquisalinus luteolus]